MQHMRPYIVLLIVFVLFLFWSSALEGEEAYFSGTVLLKYLEDGVKYRWNMQHYCCDMVKLKDMSGGILSV